MSSTRPWRLRSPGRRERAEPRDRLEQLVLAVALHAGHAEHLARPDLQVGAVEGAPPVGLEHGPADREHGFSRGARPPVGGLLGRAADHRLGQLVRARRRDLACEDGTAGAHHGDAVGGGEDFGQLVRHQDDRAPLRPQERERFQETVHFERRQHRRRLVEEERPRPPVQLLDELDPLALAEGEVRHFAVRVELQPEGRAELLDGARRGRAVDPGPAARLGPEHDVLRHRERLDQREVLVHHAEAKRERVARPGEPPRDPVDRDLARVGRHQPEEDREGGGLPRPVLADERVDLAAADREVDSVVRDHGAEALGHTAQLRGQAGVILVGHTEFAADGFSPGGPADPSVRRRRAP
jgi:hypothetical protein